VKVVEKFTRARSARPTNSTASRAATWSTSGTPAAGRSTAKLLASSIPASSLRTAAASRDRRQAPLRARFRSAPPTTWPCRRSTNSPSPARPTSKPYRRLARTRRGAETRPQIGDGRPAHQRAPSRRQRSETVCRNDSLEQPQEGPRLLRICRKTVRMTRLERVTVRDRTPSVRAPVVPPRETSSRRSSVPSTGPLANSA